MGVRDQLERVAAWFGFGVDDDEDYYDEEEERRPYAKDRYAGGRYGGDRYAPGDDLDAESGPTVRRLGRAERSSAFGTSLGNLFGSEGPGRDRSYGGAAEAGGSSHLRAVPDQRVPPTRVSVVHPTSFNDAQALADRFKRQQPVIVNLQNIDRDLSRRLIDFASGLCYALNGSMEKVAQGVYLLTPANVSVSPEDRRAIAENGPHN